MLFIVIILIGIILYVTIFRNINASTKQPHTIRDTNTFKSPNSKQSDISKTSERTSIEQEKNTPKEIVHIMKEIERSLIIINYAFFVETIIHEWQNIKEKISYLERIKYLEGTKIDEYKVLYKKINQYNEGILKAIQRQFDGYKWVVPLLKSQSEIILYTHDMYTRIEHAKVSTINSDNKNVILNILDDIHIKTDEFCSPFISISQQECKQNAKKLKSYCVGLLSLFEKLLIENKKAEAYHYLNEAAKHGYYCANNWLLGGFTGGLSIGGIEISCPTEYRWMKYDAQYRVCAIGAIHNYRLAQKSITEYPKYKSIILLAMAYGISVDDYTNIPERYQYESSEKQNDIQPINIYECPHEGVHYFQMDRFVELSSYTQLENYYYYRYKKIKIRFLMNHSLQYHLVK